MAAKRSIRKDNFNALPPIPLIITHRLSIQTSLIDPRSSARSSCTSPNALSMSELMAERSCLPCPRPVAGTIPAASLLLLLDFSLALSCTLLPSQTHSYRNLPYSRDGSVNFWKGLAEYYYMEAYSAASGFRLVGGERPPSQARDGLEHHRSIDTTQVHRSDGEWRASILRGRQG